MKLFKIFLLIAAILFIGIFSNYQLAKPDPKIRIEEKYKTGLEIFKNATIQLSLLSNNYQDSPSQKLQLQKAYLNCRNAFKNIEMLFEYYNAPFSKNFVNGAPLPKLDEGVDAIAVKEPRGLQVLDELIFSDTIDIIEIKKESQLLVNAIAPVAKEHLTTIQDRHVFEASRQELVRIFTLGITGFDTPASDNALADALVSFHSINQNISKYFPLIEAKNKSLKLKLENLFSSGVLYLKKNKDFDSFDRVYFAKIFINPLYEEILAAQILLNIETWNEVSNVKKPIDYFVKNIFDKNFLNPNYYMQMPKEKFNNKLINLGKMLFFDPILSENNQRSCASCHQPNKAFTDGKVKSTATNYEGTLRRNAPTLLNSVFADKFFYDLRTDVLEDQIEHVIVNEKEFHTDYLQIFEKINSSSEYVQLFGNAFPEIKNSPINKYTISSTLAAYVGTLNTFNSSFDLYMRGEKASIDASVIRGFNLFAGKAGCATCHFSPIFNGTTPPHYQESESEVLGVPANKNKPTSTLDTDLGRGDAKIMEVSEIYMNSFKTPTLRNIALTAPYMHNGVYETLEEVMDFYNDGGGEGLGIHTKNQTLPTAKLNLNKKEIGDVISFMNALTDTTGTSSLPIKLPSIDKNNKIINRKIGGEY